MPLTTGPGARASASPRPWTRHHVLYHICAMASTASSLLLANPPPFHPPTLPHILRTVYLLYPTSNVRLPTSDIRHPVQSHSCSRRFLDPMLIIRSSLKRHHNPAQCVDIMTHKNQKKEDCDSPSVSLLLASFLSMLPIEALLMRSVV